MNQWNQAEQRVERAQHFFEAGQFGRAAEELRTAIAINPHNACWHFNLGLTLDAMAEFTQAIACYQRAAELEPEDLEALNALGVDYTRTRDFRKALECFEQIEKLDPSYEPAYCNRIVTYTQLGDHEQAELMFYLAREYKKDCPLCLNNIANNLFDRGQFRRAIMCWQQALRLDPRHPLAHSRIAEAHWAAGDLLEARKEFLLELRRDPGDIDTLLDLGELLTELGRPDEAAEKFRRVLEQAPDDPAAHYGLGELAAKAGRIDEAIGQFRLVLRLDQHYPGAHMRLGDMLLRQGHTRQGGAHLLAELRHADADAHTLMDLGQLLLEARKFKQAHKVLSRVVAQRPESPQARHTLAVSCLMMGRLDEGIVHCRRALKLKPDYVLALYNLAQAHVQKSSLRRARRYAAKALAVAPRDPAVRDLAGKVGLRGWGWGGLRRRVAATMKRMFGQR